MTTQSGAYDNASYLTRQNIFLGKSTAGASGTGLQYCPPTSNVRIRNVSAYVVTAGTTTGAASAAIFLNGTSTLGSITFGTSTAGTIGTTGDLNTTISQGTPFSVKNGTDATLVYTVTAELHIDPASAFTAP